MCWANNKKHPLQTAKFQQAKKKKENNNIKLKYLFPSCAAVGCVHFKLHADQISGMQQTVLFENTEPSSCKGHMRKERANERCIEWIGKTEKLAVKRWHGKILMNTKILINSWVFCSYLFLMYEHEFLAKQIINFRVKKSFLKF